MKKRLITMIIAALVLANIFVTKADANTRNYSITNKEDVQEYLEMTKKYKVNRGTNFTLPNVSDVKVDYEVKEGIVPIEAWEGKEILIYEVVDKIGKPINEVTYADIAEIKVLTLPGLLNLGQDENGEIIKLPVFEGELPEILKEFKTLRILDLNFAPITKLPDWFYSLTELTEVNLLYTGVSEISANIKNLTKLNRLNIMGTDIASLPKEISDLDNLEAINVATIPFTSNHEIPKEVFDIKNLKELEFPLAELNKLPEDIKKLTKLEYVDFSGNKFGKFPEELYGLKNLEIIILIDIGINVLDERVSEFTKLNGLVLAFNNLTKLPESLKYIKGESNLFVDASFNFLAYEPVLGEGQNIELCGNFLECIHPENDEELIKLRGDKKLLLKTNALEIESGNEISNDKIKELVNVNSTIIINDEKYEQLITDFSSIDLQFELLDESGKIIGLKDTKNLPVGVNKLKVKIVGSDIDNDKAIGDLNINVKAGNPVVPPTEPEVPPTKPEVPAVKPTPPATNNGGAQNTNTPKLPNTGGSNPIGALMLGLFTTSSGFALFRRKK